MWLLGVTCVCSGPHSLSAASVHGDWCSFLTVGTQIRGLFDLNMDLFRVVHMSQTTDCRVMQRKSDPTPRRGREKGSGCTVKEVKSVTAHGVSACDVVFLLRDSCVRAAQLCRARMGTASQSCRGIRGALVKTRAPCVLTEITQQSF